LAIILVVEDDLLLSLDISEALEDDGYDVIAVASADEAIKVLESRNEIRTIFTDIDHSRKQTLDAVFRMSVKGHSGHRAYSITRRQSASRVRNSRRSASSLKRPNRYLNLHPHIKPR
jgi:CheY-like chemotaxis protein